MKNVLITGASSGIGRELAFVFAENNYRPIIVARRMRLLNELAEEIKTSYNIESICMQLDLADSDSAEQLFDLVKKGDLEVDVLVNNAGFGDYGPFHIEDVERLESMINLNMLTLTKLSRLFAQEMVERGSGHILNIASTAAFQPVPNFAVYAATKAYVLQFSEALAFELKPFGVYVTVVCPGATQSEFQTNAQMNNMDRMFNTAPLSFMVAEFAYEAMVKKKTTAIHGSVNAFMAFMLRFTPRKLIVSAAAKMMKA